MNIKINKEQANYLFLRETQRLICGSRLYGTHREDSDKDFLVLYEPLDTAAEVRYGAYHQFQYDEGNCQYNFTTYHQFWKNLWSGDSTINADAVLFDPAFSWRDPINTCRTFNVIKAYLGFAKRDIKDLKRGRGKNKEFHIQRGLYCADLLMRGQVPTLFDIRSIKVGAFSVPELEEMEIGYRKECNRLYEIGELTTYPLKPVYFEGGHEMREQLIKLQLNSMNIKEFRYE